MGSKRKALQGLSTNILPSRGLPSQLPVGNGAANRSRSQGKLDFASTSKTPKINNRTEKEGTPSARAGSTTPAAHQLDFVSNRNKDRTSNVNVTPFPSLQRDNTVVASEKTPAISQSGKNKTPIDVQKMPPVARWRPFFLVERSDAEEASDMDTDSDELLDMSSTSSQEGSPPPKHNDRLRQTPQELKNHQLQQLMDLKKKPSARSPNMSVETVSPIPHSHRPSRSSKEDPPAHPQLTEEYLEGVREGPADDPAVYAKLLYGSTTPLGTEIGVNQEPSLDGSEITATTLFTGLKAHTIPSSMPSFPRRDPEARKGPLASFKEVKIDLPPDRERSDNEWIEEWSLPDDQINGHIVFNLDGKEYVHPPLPPGWALKISQAHTKPYYVHPDRPISWWCPVPLKPKSEALVVRRSSLGKKGALHEAKGPTDSKGPHQEAKSTDNLKPRADDSSPPKPPTKSPCDAKMSDFVKNFDKETRLNAGYEASESSCGSKDDPSTVILNHKSSSPSISKINETSDGSEKDWETPLRSCIKTPKDSREVSSKKSKKASTPALSPVEEDEKESPLADEELPQYDYHSGDNQSSTKTSPRLGTSKVQEEKMSNAGSTGSDRKSEGTRSTPRVSLEPLDVTREDSMSSTNSPNMIIVAHHASKHNSKSRLFRTMPSSIRQSTPHSTLSTNNHTPEATSAASQGDDVGRLPKFARSQLRSRTLDIACVLHSGNDKAERIRPAHCAPLYSPPENVAVDTSTPNHAPVKRKSLQSILIPHLDAPLDAVRPTEGVACEASKSPSHSDDKMILEQSSTKTSLQRRKHQSPVDIPTLIGHQPTTGDSKRFEYSSQRSSTPKVFANTPSRSLESEGDDDSEANTDERSPLREQPKFVHNVSHSKASGTRRTTTPESFALAATNDNDSEDYSFPMDDHITTPSPLTDNVPDSSQRRVSSNRPKKILTVHSRAYRPSSNSVVQSPLSFSMDDNDSDAITAHPVDDHGNESQLSPVIRQRKPHSFSWRVLHPFHPLCSLQRLDVLLEAQRKRKRTANRETCSNRKKKATVQKRAPHTNNKQRVAKKRRV